VQKIGRSNDAARQKRHRNSELWLWGRIRHAAILSGRAPQLHLSWCLLGLARDVIQGTVYQFPQQFNLAVEHSTDGLNESDLVFRRHS